MLRPETRDIVFAAAERLGDVPNSAALSMRSGRFGVVGLLSSRNVTRSYPPQQMLEGIQDALHDVTSRLTFGEMPDKETISSESTPMLLRELSVDGLLVNYNLDLPQRARDLIPGLKVPAVWLNRRLDENCVYPDDFHAGESAQKR